MALLLTSSAYAADHSSHAWTGPQTGQHYQGQIQQSGGARGYFSGGFNPQRGGNPGVSGSPRNSFFVRNTPVTSPPNRAAPTFGSRNQLQFWHGGNWFGQWQNGGTGGANSIQQWHGRNGFSQNQNSGNPIPNQSWSRDRQTGNWFDQSRGFDRNRRNDRGAQSNNWDDRARNYGRRDYGRNEWAGRRFDDGDYRRPDGWFYRRWNDGDYLPANFWTEDYWLTNWWAFDLPAPSYGCEWVRYGNDALLINIYTGEVLDVEYGIFY
jgi:Ni/Co efflux regulator RcnB